MAVVTTAGNCCICLSKCNSDWRSCCKYVHHWHCLTCDMQHQQQDWVLLPSQSHYLLLRCATSIVNIQIRWTAATLWDTNIAQIPSRHTGRAREIRCNSFLSVFYDMKRLVIDIMCQLPSTSLSGVASHFLKSRLLYYDSSQQVQWHHLQNWRYHHATSS